MGIRFRSRLRGGCMCEYESIKDSLASERFLNGSLERVNGRLRLRSRLKWLRLRSRLRSRLTSRLRSKLRLRARVRNACRFRPRAHQHHVMDMGMDILP